MIFRKLLNLFNRKKYAFRIPKESAVIYFFYINFYNNHYLQEIIQGKIIDILKAHLHSVISYESYV